MKPIRSNTIEIPKKSQIAFQYHARPLNRTLVNLYYRHNKLNNAGKQVTSIRRAAFQISTRIPKFTAQAMNYTRPVNYF